MDQWVRAALTSLKELHLLMELVVCFMVSVHLIFNDLVRESEFFFCSDSSFQSALNKFEMAANWPSGNVA